MLKHRFKPTIKLTGRILLFILLAPIVFIYLAIKINNIVAFREVDIDSLNEYSKSRLVGKTEEELVQNLLYFAGSEGKFEGSIHRNVDSYRVLSVIINNDYVPDDSLGSSQMKFWAVVREDSKWHVYLYRKGRGCQFGRYLSEWQNFLSIFTSRLWTTDPCT